MRPPTRPVSPWLDSEVGVRLASFGASATDGLGPSRSARSPARRSSSKTTIVPWPPVLRRLLSPLPAATPELADEIAGQLGLAAGSVSTTVLALDGSDYLLAVWKADGKPGLAGVADLAARLGGELVDGELKTG